MYKLFTFINLETRTLIAVLLVDEMFVEFLVCSLTSNFAGSQTHGNC